MIVVWIYLVGAAITFLAALKRAIEVRLPAVYAVLSVPVTAVYWPLVVWRAPSVPELDPFIWARRDYVPGRSSIDE